MSHPRIIIHNSISLDGSLIGFPVNMQLHYQLVNHFHAQAHLIGSHTIVEGIKQFGNLTKETREDFMKPVRDESLPYWMIMDSQARLQGSLHEIRRFDYCKDVVIFLSETTPSSYKTYLEKREYPYHVIGTDHVDISDMLECIYNHYEVQTLITDTGRILGNLLINQGLVSEISVLIHPQILGKNAYDMFSDVKELKQLQLIKQQVVEDQYIWCVYQIINEPMSTDNV